MNINTLLKYFIVTKTNIFIINIIKFYYKFIYGRTVEQSYYKQIFYEYYCGSENVIPYYWIPRFVNAKDATARTLKI